jgi:hypothetical protein
MEKRISSFVTAGVALVALCTATTACSSSSSTQAAAGPGPTGAGTVQSSSGSGSGSAAAKATCTQLTAADVQGLMTDPVVGQPQVTPVGENSDGQQCIFDDADSEQDVDVIVVPTSDEAAGYAAAKQQTTNPANLSGVGDQAFRDGESPTAEGGGLTCSVSLGTDTQLPGVDKLVVNGTLNLTDAQNAVVAAALGTVCDHIFGSGNMTPDLSAL